MPCAGDTVEIAAGRNVWLLVRTDRDAPDAEDVLDTAGAFLSRVLGEASPEGTRSVFQVLRSPQERPGTARYIIGAARPIEVTAQQSQPFNLKGNLVARHRDCERLRAVSATNPWFLQLEFDWRAPAIAVPWPRRKVSDFGIVEDPDLGLDWLLLEARTRGAAEQPDTSLSDEYAEEVKEVAEKAFDSLKWLTLAAVVLAIGVYISKDDHGSKS